MLNSSRGDTLSTAPEDGDDTGDNGDSEDNLSTWRSLSTIDISCVGTLARLVLSSLGFSDASLLRLSKLLFSFDSCFTVTVNPVGLLGVAGFTLKVVDKDDDFDDNTAGSLLVLDASDLVM